MPVSIHKCREVGQSLLNLNMELVLHMKAGFSFLKQMENIAGPLITADSLAFHCELSSIYASLPSFLHIYLKEINIKQLSYRL